MKQTLSFKLALPPRKDRWLAKSCLALLLLCESCSSAPPEAVTRIAHVSGGFGASIMSKPHKTGSIVGELKQHDTVAVVAEQEDGWTKVRFGKYREDEGFIVSRYLTPAKYAHPMVVVGKFSACVMANPAENQKVLLCLHPKDSVDCLDNAFPGWVYIGLSDGTVGFVHRDQLDFKK